MTDYTQFKDALRRFVQEVCAAVSKVELPQRLWTRIVREGEARVSFPQESRPDLAGLLFRLSMALHTQPTPALLEAVDAVRGNPMLAATLLVDAVGKPIVDEKIQRLWATNQIEAFLRAYFTRSALLTFDESAFEAAFRQLMAEVESSVVTVTELSPLMNCRLDSERIEVVPELVIRKLSTEELEEWLNAYAEIPIMAFSRPQIDPVGLDCVIEVTYEKRLHEAWGAERTAEMVSDLLTAIRLLTDRSVHIAFTQYRSQGILQSGGGTTWRSMSRRRDVQAHLDASMQQKLVETWNRIRASPTNGAMKLALRRWDIVSERFNEDDALIDYWIALESLFVPDSTQEVRYRASLRIATLVGGTAEEREQAYKVLRDSYDLRSGIVHGRVSGRRGKADLIGMTRSYLRSALLKLLQSTEPFDPEAVELSLLRK